VLDQIKEANQVSAQEAKNSLDVWTAHKTEAGLIYYYNSLTGKSTYEKPAGFMGEVFAQENYLPSNIIHFYINETVINLCSFKIILLFCSIYYLQPEKVPGQSTPVSWYV
jgi:WW domain